MKIYEIRVPVAGIALVEVEADSAKEAQEKALETVRLTDLEEWESLECFHEGNVCYCPRPWEITIVSVSDEDGNDVEDSDDE